MNIANTDTLHECTSCQMCGAVCPTGAISIALDAEGFYRPTVDAAKCVDCSLCTQVCYKYDSNILATGPLDHHTIYGARATDSEVLKHTSSGGIADLLARHLVAQGYKCIGVCYDTHHAIACNKVATTVEETEGFRGSKYIQAYTVEAFQQLVKECRQERYAVFGLPCHIYALHRFLELRHQRHRHILIDMYCHGTPSLMAWKKYDREMKLVSGFDHFDAVNFRSKIRGWGNFYVVVVVVDGVPRFISSRKKDEFYTLFFSDVILNGSCYDCQLRSTLRYADLRLGDFWGKVYVNDNRGTSAVSVVTDRGRELFDQLQGIWRESHPYSDFLPWQSYGKVYRRNDKLRAEVLKSLQDDRASLQEAVTVIYRRQSLKQKVKRHLKQLVKMLPNGFINAAKKAYYKLR